MIQTAVNEARGSQMGKKLKPCPFCGYKEQSAELFNMPFKGRGWSVSCPDCGAMTHLSIDRETAEKRWNERVSR